MITADILMNKLYKSYGTDSGILFGIKDRSVVEAIVTFTLDEIIQEARPLEQGLKPEKQDTYRHLNANLKRYIY